MNIIKLNNIFQQKKTLSFWKKIMEQKKHDIPNFSFAWGIPRAIQLSSRVPRGKEVVLFSQPPMENLCTSAILHQWLELTYIACSRYIYITELTFINI